MAVTYSRRFAGDGSGTGAGGGSDGAVFRGRCWGCRTHYTLDVTYSRIRIDVAGPTCHECDPPVFNMAEEPRSMPSLVGERPERVVKVWLASRNEGVPGVEVRDIPADGEVAKRVECRSAVRAELSRQEQEETQSAGQQTAWAGVVEAKLGIGTWQVVQPAWQAEHCDILAALAEALDQVWGTIRVGGSSAYQVVIRLRGLPEILNVLVAEVVARSAATPPDQLRPSIADHLRQVGVAVCAGTGCRACASLGATLDRPGIRPVPEELAATANQEFAQRLIDDLNLPVFWPGRTMLALEDAFCLLVTPARHPAPQVDPRQGSPGPKGRLESTREYIRESRQLDTLTRPLAFGDAGE